MDSGTAKHPARKVGLGEDGYNAKTRRGGHRVSAMFYRLVSQVILIYGSETWVLSAAMEKKVEGAHTYFLRQITRKQARRIVDRTWETPKAGVV